MATTHIPRPPAPAIPTTSAIPLRSRLFGFGSVFGKAIRDSRRAFVIELLFLAGFLFLEFAAIPNAYPTPESRQEIVKLANDLGAAGGGLTGPAVNVGTVGGYISWKYGPVFVIVAALWSILSLTGTLAGEAQRGSLDFVAAAPLSRRRIAFEKTGAHVTLMAAAVTIVTLAAWLGGTAFAKLPGDAVSLESAFGFALWVGLMALAFGGLGFVLAQFLGRAAGAWIAGFVLVVGQLLVGYRSVVPAFDAVYQITPWWWTWNHVPLAGQYDWPSLVPVAIMAAVLLPLGVEVFVRRDIGAASTSSVSIPGIRLPSPGIGLGGPLGRSFAERLPLTLAWGIGVGAFLFLMAGAAGSLADSFAESPDIQETFRRAFPTFDIATAGGFLQLTVQLLYIVVGFTAATLISGWASDETAGRLEMVLATPISRRRWVVMSGLGVIAAIGLMTAIIAIGIGAGAATTDSDVLTPMAGSVVLGLFASAMAGIGFAVGGVFRASIAAWVVVAVVAATYLIDLIIPALGLPDDVRQIALTAHLGRPMVGEWDWAGVVACVVLALGGLGTGAWGLNRRDVEQ
jgi:ABC-2 type transport system permease protein